MGWTKGRILISNSSNFSNKEKKCVIYYYNVNKHIYDSPAGEFTQELNIHVDDMTQLSLYDELVLLDIVEKGCDDDILILETKKNKLRFFMLTNMKG